MANSPAEPVRGETLPRFKGKRLRNGNSLVELFCFLIFCTTESSRLTGKARFQSINVISWFLNLKLEARPLWEAGTGRYSIAGD